MAITTFIPQLWSARLLENLQQAHVATQFVNRDYEGEIRKMGDTVHINSIGAITIGDYVKNTDIGDPETLSAEDQELVVDQAKFFNFQVDDVDAAQAAGPIMDGAMREASYGIADVVDKKIFTDMAKDAGTKLKSIALTKDNVYEQVVALRTALNKKHVPKQGRKLAVSSDVTGMLLLDDRFVKATESANVRLENGFVGRVAGFDVYETENAPANTMIAAHPMATSFAEQIVEIEAYRPEKRFADAVKGLNVYGVKVVRGNAIAVAPYTLAAAE